MKTKPPSVFFGNSLKILSILFFSLFISSSSYAQKIEMERKFDFLKLSQNGETLSRKETYKIVKVNEEAFRHAKNSYNLGGFAFAFRFFGLVGILLGVGGAGSSKEENWKAFAWGGGLTLASIPFTVFSNKEIVKAVNIYNAGIPTGNNYRKHLEFNIVSNDTGIGIGVNF